MNEERPRLSTLCSNTFLFLTTFRRLAGRTELKMDDVRARLESIFHEQHRAAEPHPELYELYEKARYPLVVAADGIIRNSEWEHAREWPLLEERQFGSAVGGQKFFALREDPAYGHDELQEVFYLCIALGFEGQYLGQHSELAEIRSRAYLRLNRRIQDSDEGFTPRTTEETMGTEPVQISQVRILRFVALLLGVILMLVLASHYGYSARVKNINDIAGAIAAKDGQDVDLQP